LCGLARVALREDLDWAQTLCEEALQTVKDTDDQLGRTNALHVLGVAAQMRGNLESDQPPCWAPRPPSSSARATPGHRPSWPRPSRSRQLGGGRIRKRP
jgi:hypothetical protein